MGLNTLLEEDIVSKKNDGLVPQKSELIDETALFKHVSDIIEKRKALAGAYANCEVTMMYWEIGKYINTVLLGNERAAYGKQIVVTLARQLVEKYGNSFEVQNLRRMIQLSKRFTDIEIVVPLARQLSWSHFLALLPIRSDDAFMYYAQDAAVRQLGKRELRQQIASNMVKKLFGRIHLK